MAKQLRIGQSRADLEPTIQVSIVKRAKDGTPLNRYTSRPFWGNYAGISAADFAERHGVRCDSPTPEEGAVN